MKRKAVLFLLFSLALLVVIAGICLPAYAAEQGEQELNETLINLLDELDLSELQKYLDENQDSYLHDFGGTAKEIVGYLIHGNINTDYAGYIHELFAIIFKNVISLVPAFTAVTGVALLSAIINSAEGSVISKSTSKIINLACCSMIILVIVSMLTGIISKCIVSINNIKKQIEIITPILTTLTVLSGGTGSAAIYQPSAIFLTGGAVEIVCGFIYPSTIIAVVLNLLSKLNPQISFVGITALIKSVMKWVIGITITIFSIFITIQSSASSLFDGILFKATKYVVSNSVPIVGNFLSSGFDMLTSASILIKSSVGLCGFIILLSELIGPIILLIAFSLMLKLVGAVVQPIGDNNIYKLLSDLSKDVDYFIAGLLTVAFMYALVIMLIINSANSFI